MDSHELAARMRETAEYLESRAAFGLPSYCKPQIYLGNYYEEKAEFITAVKSLGAGTKEYSSTDFDFKSSTPIVLWLCISRDKVCRKVQEEKWECEALLTPEDVAELEGA